MLALVGALFGIAYVPLLCSIAAVVQGVRARREIRSHPELKGTSMAMAGIVIGVLALVFYIALAVALRIRGKDALI
jgi:Domain of unknown function (DUF4190)